MIYSNVLVDDQMVQEDKYYILNQNYKNNISTKHYYNNDA